MTTPKYVVPPGSLLGEPRESALVGLTRRLLDYLLSGHVEPGTQIPSERQLAAALGVGRSPVREAIKSLSLLGLLDVRAGDGTYLSPSGSSLLPQVLEWGLLLDAPQSSDVLEFRAEMEIAAAGLATERITEDDVVALRRSCSAMRRAAEERDLDAYIDADLAFHLTLARAAGNGVLTNLLTNLGSMVRSWMRRAVQDLDELETSIATHEAVVVAIESGDAEEARRAMREHMAWSRSSMGAVLGVESPSITPV